MRLPSAIRTFDPAFFHQSPGRFNGVPMLGRGLLANHPYGALKGSLGVTPCLLGAGHTVLISASCRWSKRVSGGCQPGSACARSASVATAFWSPALTAHLGTPRLACASSTTL